MIYICNRANEKRGMIARLRIRICIAGFGLLAVFCVLNSVTHANVSVHQADNKRAPSIAYTVPRTYSSASTPDVAPQRQAITTGSRNVSVNIATGIPQPTTANDSYVFATILTLGEGTHKTIQRYVRQIDMWLRQIKCHGIPSSDIVVIIADSVQTSSYDQLLPHNVTFIRVPALSISGTQASYRDQVTKMYLWNLTAWSRVIYYDSDMFFMQSPLQCLQYCNITAELCAVPDIPGTREGSDRYFNAGFLIVRPSSRRFEYLTANIQMAANRRFAEQDMLNDLYMDNYTVLPRDCNVVWPRNIKDIGKSKTAIALHDKYDWTVQAIPPSHPIRICANI